MPSFIKQTGHSIGFGLTSDEATDDAYVNACILSLANDDKQKFVNRREELHPWMPTANVLHISSIGCLVYKDMKITETRTGKTIMIAATGISIFQYLAALFGTRLSYTDIVCVLREELDTFFQNISTDFVMLKNMSVIQVQRESADFIPDVLYRTNAQFIIGVVEDYVGIKYVGEDCYYVCFIQDSSAVIAALHRLLYRTGNVLVDDRLEEFE